MTVTEAARELEVSVGTVYALIRAGKVRHERHGLGRGAIRITAMQLAEYREGVSRGGDREATTLPIKPVQSRMTTSQPPVAFRFIGRRRG
jgi:excisionase family DNA binding protein